MMMTAPSLTVTPIIIGLSELTDSPLVADGVGGVIEKSVPRGGGGWWEPRIGSHQTHNQMYNILQSNQISK